MIKGGVGGENTKTGLVFEKGQDMRIAFNELDDYKVKENELYYKNKIVAKFYKKNDLYSGLLKEHNINWETILSKRLLPDEAILILMDKILYVIEMKYQEVAGSTDEKLQTCDFKLKQYRKLLMRTNIQVKFIYLLCNWFKNPKYKDTMNYIKSVGCYYYFGEDLKNNQVTLPLNILGLPESKQIK